MENKLREPILPGFMIVTVYKWANRPVDITKTSEINTPMRTLTITKVTLKMWMKRGCCNHKFLIGQVMVGSDSGL